MNNESRIQLRPGVLVSLKSSVTGGTSYTRTELDADERADGRKVERWETTKVVEDPEEHEAARRARGKARGEISRVCVHTAFGMLCPEADEEALSAAIARARALVDEFNASARTCRVSLYVLRGHIATTDEEAARAIGDEVAGLVSEMSAGIDRLDVEAIRAAADKARQLGAMLSAEQQETVGEAVKAARAAARTIVARVGKEGEDKAVVLADIKRGAIEKARMAFIDLDDAPAAPAEAMPAANVQRAAGLDIEVEVETAEGGA